MIKPTPHVYVCPSCGWRKAVSPKSDALMPGDYYDCCPVCKNKSLKIEKLNVSLTVGFGLLRKLFKH